eukprot:948533-Amorphochlora_amoeboformis.AAC.1
MYDILTRQQSLPYATAKNAAYRKILRLKEPETTKEQPIERTTEPTIGQTTEKPSTSFHAVRKLAYIFTFHRILLIFAESFDIRALASRKDSLITINRAPPESSETTMLPSPLVPVEGCAGSLSVYLTVFFEDPRGFPEVPASVNIGYCRLGSF